MIIDLSTSDTRAFAKQISTVSLGDHSYVIVVGDQAVAIDIQRDLERFNTVLDGIDATLVAVAETHIHNDYISGGRRLAAEHGAAYVLPANTGASYEHTQLADGEAITVGGWALRAMHTPGHTHTHTSYVLESPDGPVAIFSGGSMLVGAVGRSDLLGHDHTHVLLEGQYASVRRIADTLPAASVVAPTHGTGSFCSASAVADTTSTVDHERRRNPALIAASFEEFATSQLLGYKRFPTYYQHMGPVNLLPIGAPPQEALGLITCLGELAGVPIVDLRPFDEYAAGHLPGSLSFPVSTDDAVFMGWTLPWNSPIVLVATPAQAIETRTHLQRIGWDAVVGRIEPESLDTLTEGSLATSEIITFADVPADAEHLVDVRDPVEQRDGVLPGAQLGHLSDIAAHPEAYTSDEVLVYCQSGYRSAVAGSFLEAAGAKVTFVFDDLANYEGSLVQPSD